MNLKDDPRLQTVNEIEAGQIVGLTPKALQSRRWRGEGPAYIKVGRLVRYRMSDLLAFLEANTRQPRVARNHVS